MNTASNSEIRVRIAPSPTGFLHFGTARTALFNWIFVKNQGGKFILRIEDTDKERSKPEFEKNIIDGLRWLGLDWDEGPDVGGPYAPYKQSERGDIYENYLKKLLSEGKAYYCFCSKEDLEADKNAMVSQGLPPKYSGKCRGLDINKSESNVKNGDSVVIRFKTPQGEVEFNDIIHGKIKVSADLIGDIVIAKNLRTPLFVFAGVVDDHEMKITHVIRGEDHISNTPKQIMIQRALGFNEVKYAHLPLILSSNRSKLSKRYVETSLIDYKKQGYLSDAVVNFMALLGWHPSDDKEVLTRNELINQFELKRVQKGGAIFNLEKLEWLNAQQIKLLSNEQLREELEDFIPEDWKKQNDLLNKVIEISKDRLKRLDEFKNVSKLFFNLIEYDNALLVWKNSSSEIAKSNLEKLYGKINEISENEFGKEVLEREIMPLAEELGKGEVLWPLRVALSGMSASPGPIDIMAVLGKKEVLNRIKIAINKLL
ncbi:glutamate--tRNA ligase [Candidatus Wolfebacteria bacterium CG10_big_fil_rev_8_21_14_0_10_31_9]|uniref:Glutamate--tRNA ligase n=1 Tax=Candidatus Wolfebacteria bacterium CG10_big_fil_rev_8_21_14_0_10_31_9 TaxID=1975070 RepID=A0A2H0RCL3_9BACT|nr:MAG: glutamate--tRNA ligase [Candidatus Wolfebacteria bacterium CG10_big_fil_rev_8_21_14_0_10_31_9]